MRYFLALLFLCLTGQTQAFKQDFLKALKIQPGDICQIVAPLSAGDPAFLNATVQFVSDFGLTPRMTENIYNIIAPDGFLWYSNTDEFRGQDLANAILSEDVKMIWFINGGSGAYRTIRELEKLLPNSSLPVPPKMLVGFSASTPIFVYLQEKYNWPTMHGPILDLIVQGYYENSTEITIDPLRDLVFGAQNTTLPPLTRIDNRTAGIYPITSSVVGGSMRQLSLSMGPGYKLNTTNKIIFLEMFERDADSTNDFLDALLFSGFFDGAAAIAFGDLMADFFQPEEVSWVLHRFANEEPRITAPVFRLKGIGHAFENHPLPCNTKASLFHVNGTLYTLVVDNGI